ncbi:MAG TPA: class I SAM-dependent methyltransferase [Herpetosiphonaceae bacterium]
MTSNTTTPRPVRNKPVISVYDWSVLWFSNTFVWKCPTKHILAFYNQHISANHLDVGVGTGYFLDQCQFPAPNPRIMLLDINEVNLQRAAERIRRYQPATHQVNVLEPLHLSAPKFDSIGINYVFHILPGNFMSKAVVFESLKQVLNPGGVIFGTTILGKNVPQGALARSFLKTYNEKGIFGNAEDTLADLEDVLKEQFHTYTLQTRGCVAFFTGQT